MARASAWGLGSALAYRAMPEDEQAELFCLFTAHEHLERLKHAEQVAAMVGGLLGGMKQQRQQKPPPARTSDPTILKPALSPADLWRT